MIFRFDDMCGCTDFDHAGKIATFLRLRFDDLNVKIMYCFSPIYKSDSGDQRIFPKIWNAYSDYRKFYGMDRCEIPDIPYGVEKASHGLIHVDHRLLPYDVQEMSILTSCSLIGANIFVPPFNKWNEDTVMICNEHNIELIKFEDGWKCIEYEKFDPDCGLYYLHSREMTLDQVKEWTHDM